MEAAYTGLEDETKGVLNDLKALHSLDFSLNRRHSHEPSTEQQKAKIYPVAQPVVQTHPETRRQSIFLCDHAEYIEGWNYEER